MNCHQILSGACNIGDHCFAVGSVEGIPFTAYAAGCNIVILASNFERVQIIPGANHNYIRISCIDCSTDTGKIAAAYDNQVCIFEPTPLPQSSVSHQLDYRWVQTSTLQAESSIGSLSWNLEGTRLLTGGDVLQLWHYHVYPPINLDDEGKSGVTFELGEDGPPSPTRSLPPPNIEGGEQHSWECVWKLHTAVPVAHMAFSPDGTLFATAGRSDRLVKIWFENKPLLFPGKSTEQAAPPAAEFNYGFVYIAHPRAVTQLSWRHTSKYMPKGSVSNMLITSCRDNICRVWVETVLPDDGLVNMSQFDPLAAQNPKFRTHRHKHRFMQRLKHMKTCFHIRRQNKNHSPSASMSGPIPTLPSTFSVHDFHNYGFQGTGVSTGLHFHLAASINAETDIPLVPSLITADPDQEPNFILHWLNNKEMHFSLQAEALLHEMTRRAVDKEDECDAGVGNIPDEESVTGKRPRVGKGASQDESSDEVSGQHPVHAGSHASHHSSHQTTLSNATSVNSLATDAPGPPPPVDSLDSRIETLLRDWHHGPDLLFSIHPIDGSFLIWVVEWLDEYHPGSFRQAQVSFSTRIPSAFPLGDAMTMSTNIRLYNACAALGLRSLLQPRAVPTAAVGVEMPIVGEEEEGEGEEERKPTPEPPTTPAPQPVETEDPLAANPAPVISMVSKHRNGTLNLWQLTFADKSQFSSVLSISHGARASGHRFRVNDITCHPVLPLLLTTSHHNIPEVTSPLKAHTEVPSIKVNHSDTPTGFCSELILWRVDAVGPLSKSGGVSELARVNSPEISAFSNVAWIPTLLPSTTLGSLSNSPSACFVASDGHSLRVYQAVIDARTLLAEINSSERRSRMMDSMISLSTESSMEEGHHASLHNKIRIVSQQSTARPGCVIQLDAIDDATHDWQNTQFLHVFQEQLVAGEKPSSWTGATELGLMETHLGAMVDLQQAVVFEEPFYIVLLEKSGMKTIVHMWRLVIASQPDNMDLSGTMMYVPDSQLTQDDDEDGDHPMGASHEGARFRRASDHNSQPPPTQQQQASSHVIISTTKVCTQALPLPNGVEVVHAAPAAGHLSSASIYPACFAPYTVTTACSDSTVRFWKCKVTSNKDGKKNYEWCEWEMRRKDQNSLLEISGKLLNISVAYSGRIACAYKYGESFTRPSRRNNHVRFVNMCVAIYECESTGGSEWILEDTIHLKNIEIPTSSDPNAYSISSDPPRRYRAPGAPRATFAEIAESPSEEYPKEIPPVPSVSTMQHLRRSITERGNVSPPTQKHLVQLDWVSNEDGSHILTVAVGSKVMLFTPVSSDLAQANMKAMKESQSTNRPILRKASSLAAPHFVDEIRWMKLRKIELQTADGLPALPMQISWVRDGILVVGMDSEMHVYSQWKPSFSLSGEGNLRHQESEELNDSRNLKDEHLLSLVQENTQRRLATVPSMTHLTRVSSILGADKKKRGGPGTEQLAGQDYMPDYGLFEASRIACPVLPQYHPKQLMELLNSGKIRWVKAILAHLVRCISGTYSVRQGSNFHSSTDEESLVRQRGWSRSRALSVSYAGAGTTSPLEPRGSTSAIPEEVTLDYAEITSIPPLPLWTLLAADKEMAVGAKQTNDENQDYEDLFDAAGNMTDESLDQILEDDPTSPHRHERRPSLSGERQGLSHFGPRQGRLLSRLLTHTHLPGLSSLDQMHLLALADTVSTCNTDFSERFAIDAAKTAIAKENLSGVPDGEEPSTDSLDDCGLRFLLAMKHFSYLLRCLPLAQRAHFTRQGVGTNNIVWAFHSESEEELLSLVPSYAKGSPRWGTLKELGVGWWLRNFTLLKVCAEKLAKAAFQFRQDPLDAAIFYLAMKKKSLVWGLFRSKRDERMTQFFANNFSEDRWRKAALKNAFALLGKQRFEHAAAFFLLAGAIRDAIDVCLNKLEDLQLAMVIARLYEGELEQTPPSLRRLLFEEVLGSDAEGNNYDPSRAHPDPFLRSMALWILKDYTGSLSTLLHTSLGTMHAQYSDEDKPEGLAAANPNVFNFYVYLRTHPLLIRQYIAATAQERSRGHAVVISGFSYGSDTKQAKQDKQLLLEDSITPLERQLYFTTAHAHFKAGCPALALEVLSKLPSKVLDPAAESPSMLNSPTKSRAQDSEINSGILSDIKQQAWDQKADQFDWSAPVSAPQEETLELDWSQPVSKFEDEGLDLGLGNDSEPEPEEEEEEVNEAEKDDRDDEDSGPHLDIMAQQLKFVACLKILMEELSTLATGFEVDGGQLRYQLYMWLEREVEALRYLCSYSAGVDPDTSVQGDDTVFEDSGRETNATPTPYRSDKPTLHEIIYAEKMDFEAKVQRAAKRKKWLKANETLLRTLLSYCSLHGASGGGLASVRMELVLLLQELQQEKTQQQLLSPLPFPTTLPLLSASVACNKTVVADPVRHLQAMTHDMLQTLVELRHPPVPSRTHLSEVLVLRDLAVALSACIYQCLCDSDTFSVKQQQEGFQSAGMETLARLNVVSPGSHLIAGHGRRRRYSSDEPLQVTTLPSKWPGVTNLRALLAREKDEDTPRLNVLLVEAFVATFMSLVVYALCTCDCNILYRLVGQSFSNSTWAALFGGGVKKLLRVASTSQQSAPQPQQSVDSGDVPSPSPTGTTISSGAMWTAVTSLTKQRVRLNMRLLGQFGAQTGAAPMKEDRPTYREQFVPPEMSMVSYFLVKPLPPSDPEYIDYDSAESADSAAESEKELEEEDVFVGTGTEPAADKENTEHSNPSSYSWCVLRLAMVQTVQQQLRDFLTTAGIELQELPVSSPLVHAVLRGVHHWVEILRDDLDARSPAPPDFIPGCFVDSNTNTGPAIHKYRSLLEKFNTPFNRRQPAASPARRLWSFLVRQEAVQDTFIRAVFGKKRSLTQLLAADHPPPDPPSHHPALPEPVRIIHKEQDSISAFCLNEVSSGLLALATPREIQEMDISLLLESPAWLEDECEFDIVNLSKEPELLPASSFLVIQTAADRPLLAQNSPSNANTNGYSNSPATAPGLAGQSGRGASVVHKHKVDGIRRISAHPTLPVYVTGSQDGSVQMWEWGHNQSVATPRPPGTFAKVTRVRFSQHGNKFGVADGDGNLSLWQAGLATTVNRPFFNYQVHSKLASDLVFLGSCSLLATSGHSSESRNVALWDTLLPQSKALVTAFSCHDQGCSSIVYAPQHQMLLSAGKKGDVCVIDVRQRVIRQRLQAHESAVKCLAIDPNEEFFVTGSADGDIKVWSVLSMQPYFMFPGEHARSSFFKNIGQGVTQLHVDSACRLFSCGADGSMKVRQLPERDIAVQTFY